MNRLYQQMNTQNAVGQLSKNDFKQVMNTLRNASNPQALLSQMMQNNPQLKQVMTLVQQSGGDPKAAFYTLANQRGIDPDAFIKALNN